MRDSRSSSASLVILIGVLLAGITGCTPQVLHSPRVEPGATGALHVGAAGGFTDGGEISNGNVFAVLYGGARHGWVARDGEMAGSFGLQVPLLSLPFVGMSESLDVLAETSYADLYFQPIRSAGAGPDLGAGVMASTAVVMPYVQYGLTGDNGNSWYTTQGLLLPVGSEHALWMPSISFRDAGGSHGTAVNYTAGAGIGMSSGIREHLLIFSITAELGLDRKP